MSQKPANPKKFPLATTPKNIPTPKNVTKSSKTPYFPLKEAKSPKTSPKTQTKIEGSLNISSLKHIKAETPAIDYPISKITLEIPQQIPLDFHKSHTENLHTFANNHINNENFNNETLKDLEIIENSKLSLKEVKNNDESKENLVPFEEIPNKSPKIFVTKPEDDVKFAKKTPPLSPQRRFSMRKSNILNRFDNFLLKNSEKKESSSDSSQSSLASKKNVGESPALSKKNSLSAKRKGSLLLDIDKKKFANSTNILKLFKIESSSGNKKPAKNELSVNFSNKYEFC